MLPLLSSLINIHFYALLKGKKILPFLHTQLTAHSAHKKCQHVTCRLCLNFHLKNSPLLFPFAWLINQLLMHKDKVAAAVFCFCLNSERNSNVSRDDDVFFRSIGTEPSRFKRHVGNILISRIKQRDTHSCDQIPSKGCLIYVFSRCTL